MQTILEMPVIVQRLKKVGLVPKDLAARAGVNFSTIYYGLKNPDSTRMTVGRSLTDALYSAEIELRDYLLALHPLQAPANTLEAAE